MSTASNDAGSVTRDVIPLEWERLRAAVQRMVSAHDAWRIRALGAEARVRELEAALREVSSGALDPVSMSTKVQSLEQENRFLARRLDRARESVKRISARLQFLEEDR